MSTIVARMAEVAAQIPRRVLHVVGGLHTGGAESWLAAIRPTIAAGGWSADFCLLDDNEGPLADQFREAGLRLEHCSLRPLWSFPMRMRSFIRSGGYGIVHSHVLLFSGVVSVIAKTAGSRIRITHAHNSHDGQPEGWTRLIYRRLMRRNIRAFGTHALACSADAEKFMGCSATWLPYGVDLDLFVRPTEMIRRSDYGITDDAVVMGHLGSLTKQKNQRFLLSAFAAAAKQEPKLHLALAGEGPLEAELKELAQSMGTAERTHFLGRRSDVAALMGGLFDGFLLPSLHEGLPVALLEAQAAGLPCLVSDRIGQQVIALPEKVEQLSIDGGVDTWAAAIRRLAERGRGSRRESVRRMRRAGFDGEASGARLLAFYESARLGAAAGSYPSVL